MDKEKYKQPITAQEAFNKAQENFMIKNIDDIHKGIFHQMQNGSVYLLVSDHEFNEGYFKPLTDLGYSITKCRLPHDAHDCYKISWTK